MSQDLCFDFYVWSMQNISPSAASAEKTRISISLAASKPIVMRHPFVGGRSCKFKLTTSVMNDYINSSFITCKL
ncbi:MAG: hypothetical protein EZS28_039011, partial [Streblomastix strix]